jgi:hypothetical protein
VHEQPVRADRVEREQRRSLQPAALDAHAGAVANRVALGQTDTDARPPGGDLRQDLLAQRLVPARQRRHRDHAGRDECAGRGAAELLATSIAPRNESPFRRAPRAPASERAELGELRVKAESCVRLCEISARARRVRLVEQTPDGVLQQPLSSDRPKSISAGPRRGRPRPPVLARLRLACARLHTPPSARAAGRGRAADDVLLICAVPPP